jgi:hypothetical protein
MQYNMRSTEFSASVIKNHKHTSEFVPSTEMCALNPYSALLRCGTESLYVYKPYLRVPTVHDAFFFKGQDFPEPGTY